MQSKFEQLIKELDEERETLSKVLETNSRQEIEISDLKNTLNETKHELIKSNGVINELTHFKSGYSQKLDEIKNLKNELDSENTRRDKLESKQEQLREEAKKIKQKLTLLQDENAELKHENVDYRNQLTGVKSRLDLIADKSHTELEKNSALQDQLNEMRKKLEHSEVKCSEYSQKFDLLMQKYELRKTKQKNKIERLWDYFQKERTKYKDLLTNAQIKNANDQENSSYQLLVEERNNLVASLADRDSRIRDLRRQNAQLNCKIKLLNDETENLNDRLEALIKEKNKLRRELQLNALSSDIFDLAPSSKNSAAHLPPVKSNSPPVLLVSKKKNFNSVENIDKATKLWTDMNTSCWDINYNTGNVNKYALASKNEANNYILNMTSDINSLTNTPRSFR
ncbi:myosin-10-like isoform X16 [Brachionus plicatilis]|uniref:Myosin-10-like isoform X16 n=1 Tax=Brachionus plicatilis TaxID=10195 RepID=A0A3M7Q4E8_BRAPC|nr:myosin-10-like isoform X16 [Brachionus plicatilis]